MLWVRIATVEPTIGEYSIHIPMQTALNGLGQIMAEQSKKIMKETHKPRVKGIMGELEERKRMCVKRRAIHQENAKHATSVI